MLTGDKAISPVSARLLVTEGTTLLRKTYVAATYSMFGAYICLTIVMHLIRPMGTVPSGAGSGAEVCRAGEPCNPGCYTMKHSRSWSESESIIEAASVGAFSSSLALQMLRIITGTVGADDSVTGYADCAWATSAVALCAGGSEALILFFRDSQIACTDLAGVSMPLILWIEWMCSVPFLMYIAMSLECKLHFNRIEKLGIIGSFCMIAFGFASTWATTWSFYTLMITLGVGCMLAVSSTLFEAVHQARIVVASCTLLDQNKGEYMHRHLLAKKKVTCTAILIATFPLFPALYILRAFAVISHDLFFVGIVLSGMFAKIIFANLVCDAHSSLSNPAFIMLSVEKQANKARRAFLRYVFHEVRVPLNSFSMGVELLSDSGADADIIWTLRDSCKIMGETLNDILSLQKIEEGTMKLQYKPFAVGDMVQSVLDDLDLQAREKRLNVVVSFVSSMPSKVFGDKYRLAHAVRCVLSNAIKFSEVDAVVKIIIDTKPFNSLNAKTATLIPVWKSPEDQTSGSETPGTPNVLAPANMVVVSICIMDTGRGISKEDMPHIFTPFVSTRPELGANSGLRGSGISMAITKEIVERHRGAIECRSKEGKGSTFILSIPFSVVEWVSSSVLPLRSVRSSGDVLGGLGQHGNVLNTGAKGLREDPFKRNDDEGEEKERKEVEGDVKARRDGESHAPAPAATASATAETRAPKLQAQQTHGGISSNNNKNKNDDSDNTPQLPLSALVVDDVATSRKMLTMLLKNHNVVCVGAEDGADALEAVRAAGNLQHYDIIFMDNTMPRMTGVEATHRLREMSYPNMIVGVTGNCMDEDLLEFSNSGADLVLTKPLTRGCLVALVKHLRTLGCRSVPGKKLRFSDDEKLIMILEQDARALGVQTGGL